MKEQSEKAGLKINIKNSKIMATSPIISWQIYGEAMEIVRDFIFGGSKITLGCDCSHEIKRCLLLGRKPMTNLDSVLKSRDITLLTKVCTLKAIVFPVVMYGGKSWTIKKAECWRTDAFKLVLEEALESPLDSKQIKSVNPKGNQPWIFTGLMLKLKLQNFGHLMQRAKLIGKDPDAGKDWGQEEKRVAGDEMVR